MNRLAAFFPGMRLRCGEHEGQFEEREGHTIIVGNCGIVYETLEAFFVEECGGTIEDPWEVCEFWKSWAWWSCMEMLHPSRRCHVQLVKKPSPSGPEQQMASTGSAVTAPELEIPSEKTMVYTARLAIEKDMPIMLDYYLDTRDGKAFLGEDSATKDKMLVRSEEEYTSPISKILKVDEDLIVITENSIYIVNKNIKKRIITPPSA